MEGPLVTVVTPSFNQGRFIRNTIDSVLSQSYPNVEYLVMDGGSTDDTLDILRSYGDRITWISEKDRGQSHAINKGFERARGEIVAWLNSDDVYEPGAIETAVAHFTAHPEAALVYGHGSIIDEAGEKVKPFEPTRPYDLWQLAYYWDYIMQPTTFFRKDALMRVGLLREELNWCMDWDLWIRFFLNEKVGFIEKELACSREYGETKTSTGGRARLREIRDMMRGYCLDAWPPGVFVYAYIQLHERLSGAWMERAWKRWVVARLGRLQEKYLTRYQDGWVGRTLRVGIPRGAKRLRISGSLPFPPFAPLRMDVYHGRKRLERVRVEDLGDFSFSVAIPPLDPPGKVHVLRLDTRSAKKPKRLWKNTDDGRYLAFRDLRVEYEE